MNEKINKYLYIYIIDIYMYVGKPPSFKIFLAGEMSKTIHQTDLKCKSYESDAVSLTKVEQYRLSAIVPSNQSVKLLEMM